VTRAGHLRIPRLGITIPNMGDLDIEPVRIADALFTRVQQRVLGILFGQPDRSFLSKDVIRLANSGTGAVHRELKRLVGSGLVTVQSQGWEKHYQANKESPVFEELRALVLKTVGLVEPIREALLAIGDGIQAAFIYGSVAKGTDTARSDIDLMVVSDQLSYAEVFGALQQAEAAIGRPVNPNILSAAEWARRRAEESHFVDKVAAQPKIFIVGSEDDLG
jgi:predicted nucleotidyltransferase